MKIVSAVEDNKAVISFEEGNEDLVISFALDSMRTMRFMEAALKAEKARGENRRIQAYIEVMSRAIKMIGEESFEDLEDFYENAGEELSVEEFISIIMSAFSEAEALPKG